MRLSEIPADRIERAVVLDPAAGAARDVVQHVLTGPRIKDALHGVWLGHPLHPALAQLALGSLLSASLIDASAGTQRESSRLIGMGLLASVPTAAAGWADYADGHEEQQRVGLVHAALNVAALSCYSGALLRRRGGRRGGRVLTAAGGALAGFAAALGGHLSFRLASGANHAEEIQHIGPGEWQPVGQLTDLPAGTPVRRIIGDVPVFVLRHAGTSADAAADVITGAITGVMVTVLSDRCPHLSAPLHEGELSSVNGRLRITCPWHASVFQVCDGSVVHGPATAPIPRFDTRIVEGELQARVLTLPGVTAS